MSTPGTDPSLAAAIGARLAEQAATAEAQCQASQPDHAAELARLERQRDDNPAWWAGLTPTGRDNAERRMTWLRNRIADKSNERTRA